MGDCTKGVGRRKGCNTNVKPRKGAFLTAFGGICWGVSGCIGQYLFSRQHMDS